jgi:hypothetical protein
MARSRGSLGDQAGENEMLALKHPRDGTRPPSRQRPPGRISDR